MVTDCLIRLHPHSNPPVVGVAGEIDTRTVAQFREALASAAACHDRLVIDLTGTTFLSAAALAELTHHQCRITALLITRESPLVHPLELTGLSPRLVYSRRSCHGDGVVTSQ